MMTDGLKSLRENRVRHILDAMSTPRRRGFLRSLFWLIVLGVAVVYAVAAITAPWSFHIGGRSTPFLFWSGAGTLTTQSGTYPIYVSFHPASHFSRLRLDGLRPTGGVGGTAALCTSRGVTQYLKLTGTIYNGWSSTDDSLLAFRLLEPRIVNVGQRQGYFNLYGRWQGPELVMDDRGEPGNTFRSGLKIEHASVNLDWTGYWSFKNVCASATNLPATSH
jgi:hypothetical protein